MANNKLAFAASVPFAITLNDLAFSTARSSQFVDNATTLYVDAHVSVKFTLAQFVPTGPPPAAQTPAAYGAADHQCVIVSAYGMEDGVVYGAFGGPGSRDAIDGTDKIIITGSSVSTLWSCRLCMISVQTGCAGVAYTSPPLGVAQAFGGVLPRRWGIVVQNATRYFAFAAAGCSASYTGISMTTL